jgi:aryl-alcohol dehydrogenase-like predicted oxidoreductase
MKYQELGSTGMRVSKLCLGTTEMGGDWGQDYTAAIQAARRAFELGINFFDTAYAYGDAEASLARALGDMLKSHRDELVISTKGGLEVGSSGGDRTLVRNSDPAFLRQTLEHSLRTLGTDYVDIYFIHWPDPTRPFEEAAETLQGFVDEGLVRHAGVSNFSVEQMEAFRSGGGLAVEQVLYSPLNRTVEEQILPYCQSHGIGVMGYMPLAKGLLSGALRRGHVFPADDRRSLYPAFQGEQFDRFLNSLDVLASVAADHGCTLAQLALAWVMRDPARVVPIVGAQVPAHIEDSAKAVDVELTEADARDLADIAATLPAFDIGVEPTTRAPT